MIVAFFSPKFLHNSIICCTFAVNFNYYNTTMPKAIIIGNELIHINPAKNSIEYSVNNGRSWCTRYSSPSCGTFIDLCLYKGETIAATSKGIYYSVNQGRSWCGRYTSSSCGEFQSLLDGGNELLAQTSKGFYYSVNSGRSWCRRS